MARRTASSYASWRSMGPRRSACAASRTRWIQEGSPWLPHTVVGMSGMATGSPSSSGWRLPEGDVVLLPLVGRHRVHGDLAVDGGLQPLEPLALGGLQGTRALRR